MTQKFVSAVFDTQTEAERAVSELRSAGIKDGAISMMGHSEGKPVITDGAGNDTSQDFVGKAALGAGVGTALGVAALAIPGVGPLVAAGAIAAAAIPTAAVTGAAVGLAAGSLASVFSDRDVDDDDARYYEERMGDGGVVLTVDTSGSNHHAPAIEDVMYRNGGHSSRRQKQAMPM